MNNLIQIQPTAIKAKVELRPAFTLLKANYAERRKIPADRWRLLAMAFVSIPDDVLNAAVLRHMAGSPYFPNVSDIAKHLKELQSAEMLKEPQGHRVSVRMLPLAAQQALWEKRNLRRRAKLASLPVCHKCGERTFDLENCPFCADLEAMQSVSAEDDVFF
ncbi:MAG: hypothetical protein ACPG8W_01665 [Candidatus Promineifilaceae bacterium]